MRSVRAQFFFPTQPVTGALIAGAPDPVRGYSDHPLVQSWLRKATAGEPVTFAERNALVASLAWAADVFATPPQRGDGVTLFVPEPNGTITLALGAQNFVSGDVAAPYGDPIRPAGSAIAPPDPSAPAVVRSIVTLTSAARAERWLDIHAILRVLKLSTAQLELRPAPAQSVIPAGFPPLAIVGAVASVGLVVGVGAYTAYAAYTESVRIESAAHTQQVQIVESQITARAAAHEKAKLDAAAMRFQVLRQTGTLPPELPIERAPTPIEPHPTLTGQPAPGMADWRKELIEAGKDALIFGGLGVGALGALSIVTDRYLARAALAGAR